MKLNAAGLEPINWHGKKGRSGRKKISEEVIDKIKEKTFKEILTKLIPDTEIAKKHKELLGSKTLLQMHFDAEVPDEEIEKIIKDAGCNFLKITLVTVEYTTKKSEVKSFDKKNCYYSAPNAIAQQKALDMIYKLKGEYSPEKVDLTTDGKALKFYSDEQRKRLAKRIVGTAGRERDDGVSSTRTSG